MKTGNNISNNFPQTFPPFWKCPTISLSPIFLHHENRRSFSHVTVAIFDSYPPEHCPLKYVHYIFTTLLFAPPIMIHARLYFMFVQLSYKSISRRSQILLIIQNPIHVQQKLTVLPHALLSSPLIPYFRIWSF